MITIATHTSRCFTYDDAITAELLRSLLVLHKHCRQIPNLIAALDAPPKTYSSSKVHQSVIHSFLEKRGGTNLIIGPHSSLPCNIPIPPFPTLLPTISSIPSKPFLYAPLLFTILSSPLRIKSNTGVFDFVFVFGKEMRGAEMVTNDPKADVDSTDGGNASVSSAAAVPP